MCACARARVCVYMYSTVVIYVASIHVCTHIHAHTYIHMAQHFFSVTCSLYQLNVIISDTSFKEGIYLTTMTCKHISFVADLYMEVFCQNCAALNGIPAKTLLYQTRAAEGMRLLCIVTYIIHVIISAYVQASHAGMQQLSTFVLLQDFRSPAFIAQNQILPWIYKGLHLEVSRPI